MFAEYFFIAVALVAVVSALGMLISRSPVRSALWLIATLLCVAGLYMTLHAEFLAVVQVLVYAGAIMVLFLFVIMLLNLGDLPSLERVDLKKGIGFVLGVVILAQLIYVGVTTAGVNMDPPMVAHQSGGAVAIAHELFTRYALPFEMIGILLLVATIGAVMLAKRTFQ